jgi:amyloid beta (A4) precursor protein-binding family B protein 2 (Fe65-like)
VGKDINSKEFAFIARHNPTSLHMCHVFYCETAAHHVTNTLREICYGLMQKKSMSNNNNNNGEKRRASGNQHNMVRHKSIDTQPEGRVKPHRERHSMKDASSKMTSEGAPRRGHSERHVEFKDTVDDVTTRERHVEFKDDLDLNQNVSRVQNELKTIIHCHYLGMIRVLKATGMDALNEAMQVMHGRVPYTKWLNVTVTAEEASATIAVVDHANPGEVIFEGHIRCVTFLGISINNAKLGAFIVHTVRNEFFAHVFHCEPSAGPWCKAIQDTCTSHYQKCIESRAMKDSSANNTGHEGHQTLPRQVPKSVTPRSYRRNHSVL